MEKSREAAIHQRDLRSGRSYWLSIGPPPVDCPTLDQDLRCDVAVVGGGITGALTSYLFAKAGVDTVLVDRETPGCGSTAASTGLLQCEIDTPLVELIARVGEAHAVHAYRRGLFAIDELEALTRDLGQACGFSRRSTLQLASTPQDMADLRREHECRRHFGFDVQCLGPDALRSFTGIQAPGALYSHGSGQIDAYAFTQALLRAAQAQGLRAYRGVNVERVQESSTSVTLPLSNCQITARIVIFATGYAAHEFLPDGPGTLSSTYVAASHPLPNFSRWPDGCLIWETADPYFYARQTDDGRVVIGGEDTPGPFDHNDDDLLEKKARRLGLRLQTLFPAMEFQPAYDWAGTFAETKDGLPYIGLLPGRERVYFALGYGGNGITFGMIAARLITDLFLQRPNDDAAVFRFGR